MTMSSTTRFPLVIVCCAPEDEALAKTLRSHVALGVRKIADTREGNEDTRTRWPANGVLMSLELPLGDEDAAAILKAAAAHAVVAIVLLSADLFEQGPSDCLSILHAARGERAATPAPLDVLLVRARAVSIDDDDERLEGLRPYPPREWLGPAAPGARDAACVEIAKQVRRRVSRRLKAKTGLRAAEARVSFFDLHLFLDLLARPFEDQPRTELWSWMCDPARLAALGAPPGEPRRPEGGHFTWRRLGGRGAEEKEGSHFWDKFAPIPLHGAGDDKSDIDHLLPLVGEPIGSDLRLEWTSASADAPISCEPRLTVFLWPFGWSARVDMDLRQELGFGDLADIAAAVRADDHSPLRFDGKPITIGRLFQVVQQWLERDLLGSDGQPTVLHVSGSAMVSVPELMPPPARKDPPGVYTFTPEGHHEQGQLLGEDDRDWILAIIKGTPAHDYCDLGDVVARPVDLETGFAVVGTRGGSRIPSNTFALLASPRTKVTSRRCGAANIEISAQVHTALSVFLDQARSFRGPSGVGVAGADRLSRLADRAAQLLSRWPYFYQRRVRRALRRPETGAPSPAADAPLDDIPAGGYGPGDS